MEKRTKRKFQYALGYCFVIGFGIFMTIWSRKSERNEKQEYPLIDNINKEICGRVTHYGTSWAFSGTRVAELSSGDKFAVSGPPRDLYDYIEQGDSIYKPVNCDTVYVYRYNKMEYFVLPRIRE